MTAAPVIGIDLGGTHMQVGVVSSTGVLLGRSRCHTDAHEGFGAVIATIAEQCRAACDDAAVSLDTIAGAGLAAPGAVDPGRGLVLRAPNMGWDDAPAAASLEKAIGRPVFLDNDVNAAALAEATLGAGRGHADMLAVWVGTGIGGGLIFGGRVFHGPLFTAGEIGHVIQEIDAPEGKRKLEHLASRTAISNAIAERSGLDTPPTSGAIAQAYADGDAVVREVVDGAANRIGVAIANVATVLSLGKVVLGGGLIETMGEAFVGPVERSVREHIFPEELRTIEVSATQLGPDAGLMGAAMLARQQLGG
ncbi:MAG: ROK family protein [Planctomycetota bacterium]